MKIGVISDIHGNVIALEEVLKVFENMNVEKIICCGDMIGIGPCPEGVIQKLMRLRDKLIAVKGNHERYLLEGLPEKVHDDKRAMSSKEIENHKWTHAQISDSSRKFIESLKFNQQININNFSLFITHYSMNNNNKYKRIIKNPDYNQCVELFDNVKADIFLYGHTHSQSIINEKNKWYINSGTCGCPKEINSASAGIIDIGVSNINYEQLNIKYDIDKVIAKIETIKFPFYNEVIKFFYKEILM